jgi:light-regulated signal transduction histidine kinase (bacteriophytochrome)
MKYKLFGTFQRLHGEKECAGTGMGLANVARVLPRDGARARLETMAGRGAGFFISLPTGGAR